MKIIVTIFIFFFSVQLYAASQTVIAAEDIKLQSQKFANNYLLLLYNPDHFKYLPILRTSIKNIEEDLRIIAKDTQNEDIHSILDYISYTKDELKEILEEEIDKENTQKVLDYTDSLVEGVESILQNLNAKIFKEELKFHIMKLSKLYMATHLRFDATESSHTIESELHIIEKMMQNINRNIYVSWHSYKILFTSAPGYFIPHIVSIAIEDLEQSVNQL